MSLQDILRQIKQQIKGLNDQIDQKRVELDDLQAQKAALVADRDALAAYLATLP